MEFSVGRFTLQWTVPRDCDHADIRRFMDWVTITLANTDEIEAIEASLSAVPADRETLVWRMIQLVGAKFRLATKRVYEVNGQRMVLETFSSAPPEEVFL